MEQLRQFLHSTARQDMPMEGGGRRLRILRLSRPGDPLQCAKLLRRIRQLGQGARRERAGLRL